jgi:tetratricopeptide (TPR) repeat protein
VPVIGIARRAQIEGDPAGAIEALTQALRFSPNDPNIHKELASVYVAQGRADDAFCELMAALLIDRRDAGAHSAIGQLYLDSGRAAEAVAAFSSALELMPGYYETSTLWRPRTRGSATPRRPHDSSTSSSARARGARTKPARLCERGGAGRGRPAAWRISQRTEDLEDTGGKFSLLRVLIPPWWRVVSLSRSGCRAPFLNSPTSRARRASRFTAQRRKRRETSRRDHGVGRGVLRLRR